MDDWLSRSELLIGREKLERLKGSSVLVAGLGGVGSYAAEMICRAGVGSITIADGDTVHATNRNRQLHALKRNEGKPKTRVMAERLMEINPDLDLICIQEYLRDERMTGVLDRGYDYIIDAVDTLSPKLFLIYHSVIRKIPIVSSMGSGGKFDPVEIRISDISESTGCPLARILRKRLHRLGIREGVTAVWSAEAVDKSRVIPSTGERNKASTVGTISYMPAAFGIACASVAIRNLAGIPLM